MPFLRCSSSLRRSFVQCASVREGTALRDRDLPDEIYFPDNDTALTILTQHYSTLVLVALIMLVLYDKSINKQAQQGQ